MENGKLILFMIIPFELKIEQSTVSSSVLETVDSAKIEKRLHMLYRHMHLLRIFIWFAIAFVGTALALLMLVALRQPTLLLSGCVACLGLCMVSLLGNLFIQRLHRLEYNKLNPKDPILSFRMLLKK